MDGVLTIAMLLLLFAPQTCANVQEEALYLLLLLFHLQLHFLLLPQCLPQLLPQLLLQLHPLHQLLDQMSHWSKVLSSTW